MMTQDPVEQSKRDKAAFTIKREAEWQARQEARAAKCDILRAKIKKVLEVGITPKADAPVVGWASYKHAEYIMGAASAAGGAIYVDVPIGWPTKYIAIGDIGVETPVNVHKIISVLQSEIENISSASNLDDFEDEVKDMLGVWKSLKKKLEE